MTRSTRPGRRRAARSGDLRGDELLEPGAGRLGEVAELDAELVAVRFTCDRLDVGDTGRGADEVVAIEARLPTVRALQAALAQ
jgi:hypothetical protein